MGKRVGSGAKEGRFFIRDMMSVRQKAGKGGVRIIDDDVVVTNRSGRKGSIIIDRDRNEVRILTRNE